MPSPTAAVKVRCSAIPLVVLAAPPLAGFGLTLAVAAQTQNTEDGRRWPNTSVYSQSWTNVQALLTLPGMLPIVL